ncbi:MAG TPA: M55 family metallopeptidase [Gemmatimonadales bacterium]|nr:M55 family metallopeptidase [Gemmatimonadales bacterium]
MVRAGCVLALLAVMNSAAAAQQRGMKVFISVDMEGIAGVVSGSQTSSTAPDYSFGRRMMTAEANAAIAAAFEAGATEVVVNDSHGSMINLQPDQLDRRAMLITGSPKPFGMMQGIDSTYAAVIFIGYHAQASTADAILDHTYNGQLKSVRLGGREVGEYGLNAALAGHYGVPVVLISGDGAVNEQARGLIPGIENVVVKDGIGRTAARTLHPEEARERIATGVRAALGRRSQIAPVRLTRPIALEVELTNTAQADAAMMVPGMQRLSARVVKYDAPDMKVAYSVSRLIAALAAQAQ